MEEGRGGEGRWRGERRERERGERRGEEKRVGVRRGEEGRGEEKVGEIANLSCACFLVLFYLGFTRGAGGNRTSDAEQALRGPPQAQAMGIGPLSLSLLFVYLNTFHLSYPLSPYIPPLLHGLR